MAPDSCRRRFDLQSPTDGYGKSAHPFRPNLKWLYGALLPVTTGDLVIPLSKGVLSHHSIKSDLFGLCQVKHQGRTSLEEITCFKSVGHALEDLVAARLSTKIEDRFIRSSSASRISGL